MISRAKTPSSKKSSNWIKDDAKYLEYLRQPYFHNNQPNEFFSHERLLNQFEKIFTDPDHAGLDPALPLQIGRWIPVLKNKPRTPF